MTDRIMANDRDLNSADAEVFRVLEERLAMPAATESRETLGALLADGFEEFGSSGRVYDAAAILEVLVPGGRPRIVLEEFKATVVATGVVLVRYVSRSVAGAEWKPPALRSSLWCLREGRWQLFFHQGTRWPSEEA
jgi:hypothetical protein